MSVRNNTELLGDNLGSLFFKLSNWSLIKLAFLLVKKSDLLIPVQLMLIIEFQNFHGLGLNARNPLCVYSRFRFILFISYLQ